MFETVHADWRYLLNLPLPDAERAYAGRLMEQVFTQENAIMQLIAAKAMPITLSATIDILRTLYADMAAGKTVLEESPPYDKLPYETMIVLDELARLAIKLEWNRLPVELRVPCDEIKTALECDPKSDSLTNAGERLTQEIINEFGLRLPEPR